MDQCNPVNMNVLRMNIELGEIPVEVKPIVKKRYATGGGIVLGDKSFFHGIDPQWRFIDEKHFFKWAQQQIVYRERLKNLKIKRRKYYRNKFKYAHNRIMCLAGPEWYQELSPLQKETVDNLQDCISKDLEVHKTDCVRSIMSKLGLRPLPNSKQLWYSCKVSYGCPVDFLLQLFQIMKANKEFYTINDRLILSAVVHLTLADTLEEMHIRMPSPPRKKTSPPPKTPIPQKNKYPSPYLIPSTYKRPPPKHTGTYKPPNRQYPESPYFKYICSLKPRLYRVMSANKEDERADELDKIPCELYEEHYKAETYYNKFHRTDPKEMVALLRPRPYETKVPKTKPGILPTVIAGRKPPPLLRMDMTVVVLDQLDGKKKAKCTIECKTILPDQKLATGPTVAKYVYIKDVTQLAKKMSLQKRHCRCSFINLTKEKEIFESVSSSTVSEEEEVVTKETHPCSRCGGPEGKMPTPPPKVVKVKSWIKRPKKTKPVKMFKEHIQLDFSVKIIDERTEIPPRDGKRIDFVIKQKKVAGAKELLPFIQKATFKLDAFEEQIERERNEILIIIEEENQRYLALNPGPGVLPMASFMLDEEDDPNAKCICRKQQPVEEDEEHKDFVCECANKWINYVMIDNAEMFKTMQKDKPPNDQTTSMSICRSTCESNNSKKKSKDSNMPVKEKCMEYKGTCSIANNCQRETQRLLNKLQCPCSKCKMMREKKLAKFIYGEGKQTCGGMIRNVKGVVGGKDCACLPEFQDKIKNIEQYKKRMKAKVDLKSLPNKFVISGVSNTKTGPIYNLLGVKPSYECTCQYKPDMTPKKSASTSKETASKFVIHGSQKTEEKTEFALGQVFQQRCPCHEIYKKFLDEHNECLAAYDKYIKKMDKHIEEYMEDMNSRYKNPPVTGEKLIEEEIKKLIRGQAPDVLIPEGKSTYYISGVEATALGKMFILGGALLNKREKDQSSVQVNIYKDLDLNKDLEKVNHNNKCQPNYLCNFMLFDKECKSAFTQAMGPSKASSSHVSSNEVLCQCISYEKEYEKTATPDEDQAALTEVKPKINIASRVYEFKKQLVKEPGVYEVQCTEPCICVKCGESITEVSVDLGDETCRCFKLCGCTGDTICVPRCNDPQNVAAYITEKYKKPILEIVDDDEVLRRASKKLLKSRSKNNVLKELMKWGKEGKYMLHIGGGFKRYVVLKKIPKTMKKQQLILKKILLSMAADGYPLAKLPDCHKLPYFSLWMEFRKGTVWKHSERYKNYITCLHQWYHIMFCGRKLKYPKLPLYCKCYSRGFTWEHAWRLRKMISDFKTKYYDNIRSGLVNFGRENLVTLCPYKYPVPPYLLHYYYAYVPGKLENALVEKVWKPFETKDHFKQKSCYCK